MRNLHFVAFLSAATVLFAFVSCTKEPLVEDKIQDKDKDSKIYLWTTKPAQTKVVYADGLGTSSTGEVGTFDMSWEIGDSLYAIRWDDEARGGKGQAIPEYIVLETVDTDEGGKMLFQGTTRGKWNLSDLQGGEHFILIHGHFVLDESTDGGVFDFPTSEVTKAGYANYIHHGGVEDGNGGLTFRNQDGTLANLKRHEYMVADSYVRFQYVTETDENGNTVQVRRPYLAKEKPSYTSETDADSPELAEEQAVTMLSAHTLLRLTMFMPNDMFDDIDYRLLAVSLRTESNDAIFHRYFRLHPNTPGSYGPSGWKVDWNDKEDKESNIYFRANLPGTRRYDDVNDPAASNFDQSKTVCVEGELNGQAGHYVTLYFSLPSRPLAPDKDLTKPSRLIVTAFTRTHAYRTRKAYTISGEKMKPGTVVRLNVNFAGGHIKTKAVTDPNLGVTFASGLIFATKDAPGDDIPWTYGIYDNQGEYAGLDQQTDVMGDYFIFGSIDPRQVFHQRKDSAEGVWVPSRYWHSDWNQIDPLTVVVDGNGMATPEGTTDVAALAVVDNQNNIFTTMSKKESDRVWARIQLEAKKGINRGYYYYNAFAHDTDELRHTAHQAKGAHRGLAADDPRKAMSSTIGIWIGTKTQPSLADQDKYVFLPSSNQLNNATNNMDPYEAELTGYEDVQHYRYWASKDYGNQHVACLTQAEYDALSATDKAKYVDIPTKRGADDAEVYVHHYYLKSELTGSFDATMKFSTNTRDVGTSTATCERFQVWYASGTSFHTNSGIKPMDQTFGRVVRPVIY